MNGVNMQQLSYGAIVHNLKDIFVKIGQTDLGEAMVSCHFDQYLPFY